MASQLGEEHDDLITSRADVMEINDNPRNTQEKLLEGNKYLDNVFLPAALSWSGLNHAM